MTKTIFADTYALIEIAGGNPHYTTYVNEALVTTQMNLMELYYHFLHDFGEETADEEYSIFVTGVMPITESSIKDGMKLKLKHRKEDLSYADCVGYSLAAELGIKFLTGDSKFENKENVEFVK